MSILETTIFKLKNRDISISDFEKWVYEEKSLEQIIPQDDYLELISLSYKTPSDLYEAEKILFNLVDQGKYYEWQLRRILEKIIKKKNDSHIYIEQCYDLYCDGYDFLDNLGLGYGLSITVPPSNYTSENWEQLSSKEQKELIGNLYPGVAEEAQKVLEWLDTKKIDITGHDGTYQGILYKDTRTITEKTPTSYVVATPKKKWWKLW